MHSTLTVSSTTQKLIDDVKQWSLNVVRPAARAADVAGSPMSRQKMLEACPIDISPFAFGFVKLDDELLRKKPWLNTLLLDGRSQVAARLVEAISYGDGWPLTYFPSAGISETLISALGTAQQIDKYVGGIARGEYFLSGWAMTEETGGNDVAAIRTTAIRDGEDYVLNGSKRFLSNGAFVDWAIVFATIDPKVGMAAIRAFIVEKGTPGFHITIEAEQKLGMRYNRQGAYRFENCRVPAANLLRGKHDGSETIAALSMFNRSRPYCGAQAVGSAQAAVDYAREHISQRRDAMSAERGRRVEEAFAELNHVLEEQRQLIYRSAWLTDNGHSEIKESAQAKVHAPRVSEAVILRCMQLMGPEGVSEEHPLEKWYRDVRLCDIVEGTAHIQKMIISRQLLGPGAARA
jgi:alkylation response protein AidB-like acyl-CoA dehydrogenase